MLKQEIRRVFLSPFFYLSVLILTVCNFMGAAEDLGLLINRCSCFDIAYMFDAATFGYLGALVPLLAGLATADSYLVEIRDGYHYAVLSRSTKLRYSLTKVGVAAGCGMLVVCLAHLLYLAGLAVLIMMQSGEMDIRKYLGSQVGTVDWYSSSVWIPRRRYGLYIAEIILFDCLYASVFPGIALCVSLVTKNRYVVLLSGYIYYLLTEVVLVGDPLFYLSPGVLSAIGRAGSLPHDGLYYRLEVVSLYWLVQLLVFLYGVHKKTK